MKINGSLRFDESGLSQIENLRVEKLGALPAWGSADVGRLVYVTATQVMYLGGASSWIALATGGNADDMQGEINDVEVTLGAAINDDGTFNAAGFVGIPGGTPTSFTDAINRLAEYATGKDTLAELDDVTLDAPAGGDILVVGEGGDWTNMAPGAESGLQPYSASLDNITDLGEGETSGIVVKSAGGTFVTRNISTDADGLAIQNGDGIAGDIVINLAGDVAAIEGLTGVGFPARIADDTWVTRALVSGSDERIVVTQADGVAGSPTIDLAAVDVETGTGGALSRIVVDGYGRVTTAAPVVTADLTGLLDATYVNVAGDAMTGELAMGGNRITGLGAPTAAGDAATRGYVDNALVGLTWEAPVRAVVTDVAARDAVADLVIGDRVYVEADDSIHTVTATDPLTFGAPDAMVDGAAFFDSSTETGYVFNGTTLTQFTGGGQLTAGAGLLKTGNVLDVTVGDGITIVGDAVSLNLAAPTAGGLALGPGGLSLVLNGTGGIAQDADGLKIVSVRNEMLTTGGTITLDGDGAGTGTIALGATLTVNGAAAQGITTDVGAGSITITAADASATQKGVASFEAATFTVTDGAVALTASLDDLTNVTGADGAAAGSILRKGAGADWEVVSTADFMGGQGTGSLSDVADTAATNGQVLVSNGTTYTPRSMYFLYEGEAGAVAAASATHTVTHNLGQRFCNVTVVDETNNVVIPESIVFTSANALTVTFNTAIACRVVVMGVAM